MHPRYLYSLGLALNLIPMVAMADGDVTLGTPLSVGETKKFLLTASELTKLQAPKSAQSRFIVEISGYAPPKSGSVVVVVTAYCEGDPIELGRFGIYPNRAFNKDEPVKIQRFAVPLPDKMTCRAPSGIGVGLFPSGGTGEGAVVTVANVRIE